MTEIAALSSSITIDVCSYTISVVMAEVLLLGWVRWDICLDIFLCGSFEWTVVDDNARHAMIICIYENEKIMRNLWDVKSQGDNASK